MGGNETNAGLGVLTGALVTIDDAHLDHTWPYFSYLVSGFRATRGWSRDIPEVPCRLRRMTRRLPRSSILCVRRIPCVPP